VLVDGVPMTDGSPVGEVVRRLGLEGWEMVGSAAGVDAHQVLWFRQALDDLPESTEPVAEPLPEAVRSSSDAPEPAAVGMRVTLVGMGSNRSDPHRRRLLIDAVASLTGESGWRATRIVDKAPRVVVERVTPEEADRIRRALEDLGAIVEIG
jgi:hypothetical protein